jgi:hypothetical protein
MTSIAELKSAIADREADMVQKFNREYIIERELKLPKNQPSENIISLITGPRRAGKSIYAFDVCRSKNFGYINFEDERLDVKGTELNKVLEALHSLKGNPELLVFDEIQNIEGWERFITRIAPSYKIIITGSNARLMSNELATLLTGRHMDYELLPFSFKEFLRYKNSGLNSKDIFLTKRRAELYNLLEEYINVGGFPQSLSLGRSFLSELYGDVIERDIIARYKIRYSTQLKEMSRYLISNFSSEISYSKLRGIFGLKGFHTTGNWIQYIRNSYLLFTLERFSFKLKERTIAPKKVYCVDTGMINAIVSAASPNLGRLMENLIASELMRRKNYFNNKLEIYYWKDHSQNEVDFVLKENTKVAQLMQSTYASSRTDIKDREITALVKASDELKCNDLAIISWDYEDEIKVGKKIIRVISLLSWLLN